MVRDGTRKKKPNYDANSREEGPTVDTNSLIYLQRRSSKNCDLQFANNDRHTDRQMEECNIDMSVLCGGTDMPPPPNMFLPLSASLQNE